jgi:hypothetical protein
MKCIFIFLAVSLSSLTYAENHKAAMCSMSFIDSNGNGYHPTVIHDVEKMTLQDCIRLAQEYKKTTPNEVEFTYTYYSKITGSSLDLETSSGWSVSSTLSSTDIKDIRLSFSEFSAE